MLIKTHLVFTCLIVVFFASYFENVFSFIFFSFFSTFLPDIDLRFSKLGKRKIFRLLQYFAGHRKFFHSFVFLGIVSFPLFFVSKSVFYGFVFGFGGHLVLDAITIYGIKPFYPFDFRIRGFFKTGGFFEKILFWFFVGFLSVVFSLKFLVFFN